jgi:hypothetical protein
MKTSEFFSECLQIFSIFTGTYNTTKSEMVAANTEPLAGNNPADPDINQLTTLRHKVTKQVWFVNHMETGASSCHNFLARSVWFAIWTELPMSL